MLEKANAQAHSFNAYDRAARRPARVHRARRERRRDRAHQGRGLEARNGHAGRDREPRAAGAAGDPVRGRAGLSQGHAAPVRRDQFIQAARDHARPAGAQGPARRGARLSRPHEDPPADRAEDGGEGAGVRERRPRRQGRRAEIPGAVPARARRRPLHRHRRSRDHARPRGQLGQLRDLSRHGAGQEPRLGVDLARQARAADPREIFPRRQALPGADLLRARSAAVPRRRQRAQVRAVRIRLCRRPSRRALRDRAERAARPADAGPRRDRARGRADRERYGQGRTVRRVHRLLRVEPERAAGGARSSASITATIRSSASPRRCGRRRTSRSANA